AQDNVHVVGGLVGLDADERALHVIDGEDKVVEADVAQGIEEHLSGPWEEVLPERPAAADLVLPQPRLRLMNAERGVTAQRRAEVLGVQSLLVHAVAGLVQDAEE